MRNWKDQGRHPSVLSLEGPFRPLEPAFQGCAQAEMIRDLALYEHPPYVALLHSRALVDPALRMMIIDLFRGLQIPRRLFQALATIP